MALQELIELVEIQPEDIKDLLLGIRQSGGASPAIKPGMPNVERNRMMTDPTISEEAGRALSGAVPKGQIEQMVAQRTAAEWGQHEWPAMRALINKESGFRPDAQNPTSTAYGMFQFLDSTWKGYGVPKTADPAGQLEAGVRYIKKRYGSPSKALNFHQKNNWY